MSSGSRPAVRMARRAATEAIDAVVSWAAATRRSRIPVRVTIHSSVASHIFSRSALVGVRAGGAGGGAFPAPGEGRLGGGRGGRSGGDGRRVSARPGHAGAGRPRGG